MLKTNSETIDVHLGPVWYLENENFSLEPGDSIEIQGTRITEQGLPAALATKVKKDSQVLILRDEYGFPLWGGRARQ